MCSLNDPVENRASIRRSIHLMNFISLVHSLSIPIIVKSIRWLDRDRPSLMEFDFQQKQIPIRLLAFPTNFIIFAKFHENSTMGISFPFALSLWTVKRLACCVSLAFRWCIAIIYAMPYRFVLVLREWRIATGGHANSIELNAFVATSTFVDNDTDVVVVGVLSSSSSSSACNLYTKIPFAWLAD